MSTSSSLTGQVGPPTSGHCNVQHSLGQFPACPVGGSRNYLLRPTGGDAAWAMLGQLEILETGEEDTERREKPGASRNTVELLSVENTWYTPILHVLTPGR